MLGEILKTISFLFIFSSTSMMLLVCLFYENYRDFHIHLVIGGLILLYFLSQSTLACVNRIGQKRTLTSFQECKTYPSMCFVVVGYREDKTYWENCLNSLYDCQYNNLTGIFAFVDGDEEEDQFMHEIFENVYCQRSESGTTVPKATCTMLPHRGKRYAMHDGFHYIKKHYPTNEYIIIIDSDTVIEPKSTDALVSAIDKKENIGCATGTLKIFNQVNLLTRVINARYGYAFDIERSAMSYFGCMNCCSGPFSIYRQKLLTDKLLGDFLNQTYCCVTVGPGDDRHLTNLIMMSGNRSVQTSYAIAQTESPIQFYRFLNQQLRWMRSFYREQIWQIRSIPHQNIYLSLITTYEILFPFFILLGFFQKFFITVPSSILIHRAIYGIAILSLRTLLLVWMQGWDCNYFLNILYFPLYFFFILPIKLYAMVSCSKMGWITSSRHSILTNSNIETSIMTCILVAWFALIVYYIHGFDIY